jgi:hypothetical protein
MDDRAGKHSGKKSGRVLDIFVIILCLAGAGFSLYMFQNDLFMTLRSHNVSPVGTVTIKYNTVQRRLSDRVVWDRLYSESPVYNGDLIHMASQSGAILNIDDNHIELGENTLIRVQKENGRSMIDFFTGEINITASADSGTILLAAGERQIEAAPGQAIGAAVRDDGKTLLFNEETVIIQDADGREVVEPAVFVTQPRQNAHYLNSGNRTVSVDFAWNRFNLKPEEKLRLQIAGDRNFSANSRTIGNLDSNASSALENGSWHWRLSLENTVLASGRLTVSAASAPVLLSPEMNRSIRVRTAAPEIIFRWTEVENALHYVLQVCQTRDFSDPSIITQVQGTSFVSRELGAGTWYWRVQPVYPPSYIAAAAAFFSNTGVFYVTQDGALEPPVLNMPASGALVNAGPDRADFAFSWSASRDAVSYTIQISSGSDMSNPVISRTVRDNFFVYTRNEPSLPAGQFFWNVFCTDEDGNLSPPAQPRPFMTVDGDVVQRLVFPPDRFTVEEGHLRDTRFAWRTNLSFDRRLQVSSLPDFSRLEINESVTGDSFQGVAVPAGEWYWRLSAKHNLLSPVYNTQARRFTVTAAPPPPPPVRRPAPRAVTRPVTAAAPARERTMPVSLLPPPENRLPAGGRRIGAAELRGQRNIVFSWDSVEGANSYILTIYRDGLPRRQIFQTEPIYLLSYTFENLGLFAQEGTFIWQVEAVFRDSRGIIERRGQPGENTLILVVPRPGPVRTEEPGVLYGN